MAEDINDYFKTFEEYSGVVKQAIQSVVHDSKMGKEDVVETIYATPPLAFAKYKSRIINGTNPAPLISFYLSGIDIDNSYQLLGFTKLTLENRYVMRAPIIAKLSYTLTINCNTEAQGDLLIAQLLMGMPFNRPYATKLDGQWVTITASDPENLSSVEAGSETEKIARRQVVLNVDRAYLEYDIGEISHFIKGFNIHMYEIEGDAQPIKDQHADDPMYSRTIDIDMNDTDGLI